MEQEESEKPTTYYKLNHPYLVLRPLYTPTAAVIMAFSADDAKQQFKREFGSIGVPKAIKVTERGIVLERM